MKDKSYEEEMEEYENRLMWGENWREVLKEINKEMNMEKLHAIAFGEWLLHTELTKASDTNNVWWEDEVENQFTTEELYNEFIKSLTPIQ